MDEDTIKKIDEQLAKNEEAKAELDAESNALKKFKKSLEKGEKAEKPSA